MFRQVFIALVLSSALCLPVLAQSDSPQDNTRVEPMEHTPTYRVNVVARNVKAVDYRHRAGGSYVDLRGTDLMPEASGKAKVSSNTGRTDIKVDLEHMQPANKFGLENLTYVLWAITPEGRASNLGELVPNNDEKASMHVTTELQAFGLVVTAEPYFAVTQPSDLVVAENVVRSDTKGSEEYINAHYELLPHSLYQAPVEPIRENVYGVDNKVPLDLMEARNAVRIARAAQADRYASASFQKAQQLLDQAEDYYRRKQGRTPIGTVAREAAQTAEEARVMSLKQQHEDQIAAERRAAAEREREARERAENEAAQRSQAEQARADAERARQDAEAAARRAEAERQQAEAAKAQALAQQQSLQAQAEQARLNAQQAEQARMQAVQQSEQMRQRLLQQLNQVLQTRETARGLIVNMSDVLFDSGKATLKPGARERLAKVAGIILAYPDLEIQVEGHTDNVGSDQYNQLLSERRAAAVRDYLISQGVSLNNVTAQGFGKSDPIASNASATGRQQNRRVEMVVSGPSIGNVTQPTPAVGASSVGSGSMGTTTTPSTTQPMTTVPSTTQPPPQK